MQSQHRLTSHDLSLTFDPSGRLWKFRPTSPAHGHQPVGAGIVDDTIVITVDVPGIASGDVDLRVDGDVLEIRGRTDLTMDLACDVALPMAFSLHQLETVYADEALTIRVLPPAKVRESAAATPTDGRDQIETHEILRNTMRVAV
jgi:HSP20-like domain found in ArsA